MIDIPLEARIDSAWRADRRRLRDRLRSIRRAQRAGQPCDRNLERFLADLQRSIELRASRLRSIPAVSFDPELPIAARREEIAAAIRQHPVVVVSGDTGSGKSTQLPKICLSLGRGVDGLIGHTQPRRIAARSVAARIAAELHVPLGQEVGYKVRFSDATQERTYVKLMTDGVLLAESQHDRFLNQYDTLILDEAHERSLNIDFLLGFLQRLLPRRPDLKLIITSATIDARRFAAFFSGGPLGDEPAPVIEVSGRTYPVEVRYRPPLAAGDGLENASVQPRGMRSEGAEPDLQRAVLDAVDELTRVDQGDVLIFMPTEQEIHATAKMLRGRTLPGDVPSRPTEIVPLYARLAGAEQQRVFQPHAGRRIVIATNVAESSLTVPGIRSVIDTGTARIGRYSSRSKVQRLPIEPISRASADQRKGRCGRLGPGVCIRLYSQDDYEQREQYTPPEIQRSNLAAVILQAKTLGLGDIEDFPFLDRPRPESVRDGYNTLFELGAIDDARQLTDVGRALGRLPVDPRIGRLILAGADENCLHEILIIAAALETQDPRERPPDKQQAADEAHAQFADEQSDFVSYLKMWDFLRDVKRQLSRNKFQKACRDNFLSYSRVREWQDVHRQLSLVTAQGGLRQQGRRDDYDAIHRALLTGFLSGVGQRCEGSPGEFRTAGGQRAFVWPGSGIFARPPKWIMAAETVETTRRYARTVARIQRAWIEQLAPHLVQRTFEDPHWSSAQGAAMVFENVSLFGLRVVHRRCGRLAAVDPHQARDFLLFEGLVRGGLQTRARFLSHNQELLQQLGQLQHRSRRKGLLRGEEARFEFYAARIPRDVVDGRGLERWSRVALRSEPRRLHMTEADLLHPGVERLDPADYPDALFLRSSRLPLEYCFEPGAERDGITVRVPREAFGLVDPQRLEWLVPGLLHEKVVALIKTLPKEIRRRLIPTADTARRVVQEIGYANGSLAWAVARALGRVAGESIPPDWLRFDRLPPYLRMRVRVVDESGRTLAAGRDLAELRQRLRLDAEVRPPVHEIYLDGELWNREGITSWDFGELPDEIELPEADVTLVGFPAVVDLGDCVALELMPSPEEAAHETRAGIRRLYMLAASAELAQQVAWLPNLPDLLRWGATLPPGDGAASAQAVRPAGVAWSAVHRQLAELIADRAFCEGGPLPRTPSEFAERLAAGRARLGIAVQDVVGFLGELFRTYHDAWVAQEAAVAAGWKYAAADVSSQLNALTQPGFLAAVPWTRLQQFPRYFQGICERVRKLTAGDWEADEHRYALVHPRWQNLLQLLAEERLLRRYDPDVHEYWWLLEEFRLRLFAPELGTAVAVSENRLDAQWDRLSHARR